MGEKQKHEIIAVDFDGTLCENQWPDIGAAHIELISYLKERQLAGDKVILWTCRRGVFLENAIQWAEHLGLAFDAVNENLPEVIEQMRGDTRKIFANRYIDDRNWMFLSDADRAEIIGRLIDGVEDWLTRKGFAPASFQGEDKRPEDNPDGAIITGSDYDDLAEAFAAAIGIGGNDGQ